jgi:arginine exporter protein ArgO
MLYGMTFDDDGVCVCVCVWMCLFLVWCGVVALNNETNQRKKKDEKKTKKKRLEILLNK